MKRAGITLCMLGTLLWATSSVADTLSSENFERLSEGSLDISDVGGSGQYWASSEAESGSMGDLAVVKAYAQGAAKPANNAGCLKYLAVDTGAPLRRYVQAGGNALDVGSKGIYFEGDVQFTPYDGETTVDADTGDKLLVYLQVKESDDENGNVTATTNFVVKAAYYDEGNSVKETKDYVCAVPDGFDAAKWHHLVVKMKIRTNTDGYKRVFFEIAVDGSYLTSSESKGDAGSLAAGVAGSLFPSLDTTTDNTEKMVSVGFKGQGSIDNVKWTDIDPIPGQVDYVAAIGDKKYETFEAALADAEGQTIKLLKDIVIAEGITIEKTTTLDLAGQTISGSPDGAGVLAVESEGVTLTIEDTSGNGRVAYTGESEGYAVMVSDGTLVLGANGAENNFYIDGVVAATSSENLTVHGGYLKNKPTDGDTELDPPTGKTWKQITEEGDKKDYYQLVEGDAPPATGPTVDNGGTVDSTTKTITVDTATNRTVTIMGDAGDYTVEVPANVTTINGKVGTVKVKVTVGTEKVDITKAFSVTSANNATTIALDPDGSVKVNGKTIKVKPELEEATETVVPFAVAGGAATAKVKAIPGLAYVLKASTDVTKMAEATPVGDWVVADGSGTVELKDSKASESTKFYVIEVTREVTR